jgi:exonuclease III
MHISSFNVNGIAQETKRKIFFNKISELNCIALLQETHSTPTTESKWKKEWPGNILFFHGTSSSRGVCILIPKTLDCDIADKITDDEGRFLIIKININTKIFILCNVYAPTKDHKADQIKFIKNLQSYISPYENENLIIGGDFNFYLNPKLDKQESMNNKNDNLVYRAEIVSMLDSLELNDAWRTLFPHARRYTWHERGRSSRLDHFLISDHLLNNLTNYKITPGLHSDHSILTISFEFDFTCRGRGYWKFNSNLLHDKEYVHNIKKTYNRGSSRYSEYEDQGLIWELVKLKIRSYSIPYCIKKKREIYFQEIIRIRS